MNYAMLLARGRLVIPGSGAEPPAAAEGWDISTAVFSQSFSIAPDSPVGLFFKPDGLSVYVTTSETNNPAASRILQYDLLTAWDISSASFTQSFSVAAQDASPLGLFFTPDGLQMYVIGFSGQDVNAYSLTTAWDISTASYVQSYGVSAQESFPNDIAFSSDGSKMYVTGTLNDSVFEYDLMTAWDISSASFTQSFSVAAQDTAPRGVFFKPDGLKMYVVGDEGDDINEYSLASAWDISTATYDKSLGLALSLPYYLFFRADGLKMYVTEIGFDTIREYNLSPA